VSKLPANTARLKMMSKERIESTFDFRHSYIHIPYRLGIDSLSISKYRVRYMTYRVELESTGQS
jgi:hypothetical protein